MVNWFGYVIGWADHFGIDSLVGKLIGSGTSRGSSSLSTLHIIGIDVLVLITFWDHLKCCRVLVRQVISRSLVRDYDCAWIN